MSRLDSLKRVINKKNDFTLTMSNNRFHIDEEKNILRNLLTKMVKLIKFKQTGQFDFKMFFHYE